MKSERPKEEREVEELSRIVKTGFDRMDRGFEEMRAGFAAMNKTGQPAGPQRQRGTGLLAILFGAFTGAMIVALVSYNNTKHTLETTMGIYDTTRRDTTVRELLSQILEIVSLKEAWLLQGRGSHTAKLSSYNRIYECSTSTSVKISDNSKPCLMNVEIRAVLDEAQWNWPRNRESFGFIRGRRTWIARNEVNEEQRAYQGVTTIHYPALISSKGRQDLAGWVERVQLAYHTNALTKETLMPLRDHMVSLATEDRVDFLDGLLSPPAQTFLKMIREDQKWGTQNLHQYP